MPTKHLDEWQQATVTRQLCAGTYLDRTLQHRVLHKVYNDTKHRVAPSYGFDIIPVVVQAWRAWGLETTYQLGVLAVVVIGLVVDLSATVLAGCIAIGLVLAGAVARNGWMASRLGARELRLRLLRSRDAGADEPERREHARRFTLSVLGFLAIVVAVSAIITRRSVLPALPSALIELLVIVGLAVGVAATRQWSISWLHSSTDLRPARLSRRLETIDAQQESTLVVYWRNPHGRRNQSPFVGSGTNVYRLPQQTIHLVAAKDGDKTRKTIDGPPPRFSAYEFVEFLKKKAAELDGSIDPGLPGLYVRDRLFVPEEYVEAARRYLQDEPAEDELEGIINDPSHRVNHYLEIGETQTGEVVVTVFVRPTVRAGSLNLDIALGVLTRPPQHYGVVDAFGEHGAGAILRAMLRAVRDLPRTLGQSWRLLLAPAVLVGALRARTDRTLRRKRGSPVGTRVSIRQDAEFLSFRSDVELDAPEINAHKNIILQPLLNATADFLEVKGIDVSNLKGQATNIINASVYNSGVFHAEGTAIGTNSTVNNSDPSATEKPSGDEK